jgi:CheY-like chemotaxis protein
LAWGAVANGKLSTVTRRSGTHAKAGGDSVFRVLVVDDDEMIRTSLLAILGDEFEVEACGSAREALVNIEVAVLEDRAFHVICSDWQMPGSDGLELFRRLAQHTDWPSISCILMTAYADELADQVEWSDRKTLGFVRKPFAPEQLIDRVRHYAGIAQMKRGVRALRAAARNEG